MYQKLLTVAVLVLCSITDIRCRRIERRILAAYGMFIVAGHLVGNKEGGIILIMEDWMAGMIPGVFCMVISLLSHQALGYGDSILITLCGLSIGLSDCLSILFTAFFCAGIVGLQMLVMRRKSRKYELPFVPFLLLGMLLSGVLFQGG
jgi:leader peptidase (prepilin peptidase)/N-methyltransferase